MKSNILITLLILLSCAGCERQMPYPELTKKAESPNGRFVVEIRENVKDTTDRHFRIILIDTKENTRKELFLSPDEGAPGSEKIYWSADNNWFLITGTNFAVYSGSVLKNGDQLYFLYNVVSGKKFSNSSQVEGFLRFNTTELNQAGITNFIGN